jgi:hypothetical protein
MSGLPAGMTLQLGGLGGIGVLPMGLGGQVMVAAPGAAVAAPVLQTIQAQAQPQAVRTVDAAAAARRNKKRKQPERSLPDKASPGQQPMRSLRASRRAAGAEGPRPHRSNPHPSPNTLHPSTRCAAEPPHPRVLHLLRAPGAGEDRGQGHQAAQGQPAARLQQRAHPRHLRRHLLPAFLPARLPPPLLPPAPAPKPRPASAPGPGGPQIPQLKRIIRLYVYNSFHNQKPANGFGTISSAPEPPFWNLVLCGRVSARVAGGGSQAAWWLHVRPVQRRPAAAAG